MDTDKYLSGKNRNNCESVGFGKGDREQWGICCTWSRVNIRANK